MSRRYYTRLSPLVPSRGPIRLGSERTPLDLLVPALVLLAIGAVLFAAVLLGGDYV